MPGPIRPGTRVLDEEFTPAELWDHLAQRPAGKPRYADEGWSSEREDGSDVTSGWYGAGAAGGAYAEALRLAREGWPEGLKKIEPIVRRVDDLIAHAIPEPRPVYDIVGDAPDVGAYLAGIPEHMLQMETQEGAARIVRVLVNVSVSAHVPTRTIEARGAMACALVDALERAGYRVELHVGDRSDCNVDGKHYVYHARAVLKRADEPLSLDRIAFPLMHPAFARRLMFRAFELIRDREMRDAFMDAGYGRPAPIVGNAGDIIVGELYGGAEWTPERLADEVARYLAEVGVHMDGAPR
jgi:hypothetical protein